jgi:hypothetical protein
MTSPGDEAESGSGLEGFPPAVRAAWCIAVVLTVLGAFVLAAAGALLSRRPSAIGPALPVLAGAAALVAAGIGFSRGVEACRVLMAGLSVVTALACGVLIYRGVALEGPASMRLLLVVPLFAGATGAFAFIHPDVRAWARRRRPGA